MKYRLFKLFKNYLLTRYLREENAVLLMEINPPPFFFKPAISVVIPVFNQEQVIYQHLKFLADSLKLDAEILLIDDSSWDNSSLKIQNFMTSLSEEEKSRLRIKLFTSKRPWYESRCEDFLIRNSEGIFVITIQGDMKILEEGIDLRILELFEQNPRLGVVSLRQCLPIDSSYKRKLNRFPVQMSVSLKNVLYTTLRKKSRLPLKVQCRAEGTNNGQSHEINFRDKLKSVFPRKEDFDYSRTAGLTGDTLYLIPYEFNKEISESFKAQKGSLWISDYASKPIAFRRETYDKIGGYEINAFFQGWDDVDFSLKVREQLSLDVGFSPFYYSSPSSLSSSKKTKRFSQALNFKMQIFMRNRNFQSTHLFKAVFHHSL
jgi:GT2 family glycosyltransferase